MRRVLALIFLLLGTTATAQDKATVSLDLGMDAAVPGEDVSLLVMLSSTGTPNVGAIQFDVLVPTRLVSFVDVSKRSGAENAAADIDATLIESKEGSDEATLRVKVSSSSAIGDGMLVALNFDVSRLAQANSVIMLKATAVAARSIDGHQLETRALDGEVNVLSDLPTVTACFFYMH